MGAKASAAASTLPQAAGAVYAQMLAGVAPGGALRSISVREIAVISRGLGGEVGLCRSFAVGTAMVGSGASQALAHRPVDQANAHGRLEMAWTTAPTGQTGGANYLRRASIPAATGTMVKLLDAACDTPISIEPTGVTGMALALVHLASGVGPAFDVHVTWEYSATSR